MSGAKAEEVAYETVMSTGKQDKNQEYTTSENNGGNIFFIMKSKKYNIKKVGADVLRTTQGKIRTEELFNRDARLTILFLKYMIDNITYMKKYETDKETYEEIRQELFDILSAVEITSRKFKDYNNKNSEGLV